MAARMDTNIPTVRTGNTVSFVDLADIPHGKVRSLVEGKHGKTAFFDAAPGLEVLAYDYAKDTLAWAPVDAWSEHYDREVEIVELSGNIDVFKLGAAYKAQRIRAHQCNAQLAEIAGLTE
jgi:hypothetical protein